MKSHTVRGIVGAIAAIVFVVIGWFTLRPDTPTEPAPTPPASTTATASADTPTGTATSTASPSPSVSPMPLPEPTIGDGHEWATIPDTTIRFAIPSGWTVVDPAGLAKNPDKIPDSVKDMAERAGMTPEDMVAAMSESSRLIVTDPDADGFVQNINVTATATEDLPTQADLVDQMERVIGAKDVQVTGPVPTPLGPAARVAYRIDTPTLSAYGTMVAVPGPDGNMYLLTASSAEQDTVTALADAVVKSVSVTP